MSVRNIEEARYVGVMMNLLLLAMIGAGSGGIGGALTNGLEGFMVGGCAGFILGIVAWMTDSMAEQNKQERHADPVLNNFDQSAAPVYDQAMAQQPPNEPSRAS